MPLIPVTIVQGAGAAPLDDAEYQTFNIAAGASFFETMTAGGANTKGSYDEWCSSCPFDADGFFVSHSNHSAVANYLMDVGVGASLSEVVIVSNILFSGVNSASGNNSIARMAYFPIPISSGARVAGRVQCSTGSATVRAMFMPVRGGR